MSTKIDRLELLGKLFLGKYHETKTGEAALEIIIWTKI